MELTGQEMYRYFVKNIINYIMGENNGKVNIRKNKNNKGKNISLSPLKERNGNIYYRLQRLRESMREVY